MTAPPVVQLPGDFLEPSAIETLSAWSTLAAAVATAVSAGFIAWQIHLTRKSVESTDAALAIARDEFAHGQLLRVDAQRAAIDAEMPRLTVEVSVQSYIVYRTDEMTETRYGDQEPTEVRKGSRFALPDDATVPLQVRCSVAVSNDGPRRARIRIDGEQGTTEAVIAVGKTVGITLWRTLPVEEWAAITARRETGEAEHTQIGTLTYIYPGDFGAVETHTVVQSGSVLARARGGADQWRTTELGATEQEPFGALRASVEPFRRTYWASRAENRRLETPAERTDDTAWQVSAHEH